MEFDLIPLKEFDRLSTYSRPIRLSDIYENQMIASLLGIRVFNRGGAIDYEIIDWSYYDVLKKYGIYASLANICSLHNFILAGK